MPRFKETEFQFYSDICSAGYKKYYEAHNLENMPYILFESKLSKKIQANYSIFTKTERLTILEESVRTVMNMVPQNMDMFRRQLNISDSHVKYDFF